MLPALPAASLLPALPEVPSCECWPMSQPARAIAAAKTRKVVTFLRSSKVVKIKPGKTVSLKARVKGRRLAELKRLGHVRVRISVVLKAPDGSKSTVRKTATLRAPKPRH